MSRLLCLVFVLCMIGSVVSTTDTFITGQVTHAEPAKIEKNVRVLVELRDVSLMDVASKLIASTTISDAKTFPVSYKLQYNSSDIKPGRSYSVSARVTGPDGALQFINDVHTQADFSTSKSPITNIAVIRVGEVPKKDKKVCKPVKCPGKPKICPYGYQKVDDCVTCKCNDPCNPPGKPVLCGSKQRCFVVKQSDGTFSTRCDAVPSRRNPAGKSHSKADCQLPKATGPCRASLPRFYYDSSTKKCESFIYGGCGENGNNFHTKAQCEKTCKA